MGSRSDWETMRVTVETLEDLDVRYETRVVSAHRTPDLLFEYASTAAERGLKVIIAGAGGAAHLPGMTAAKTELPVLGVPIESKALKGMDSLLSIVQMPAGVPVGTLAIGRAGAVERRAAGGGDRRAGRRRGPRSLEAVPGDADPERPVASRSRRPVVAHARRDRRRRPARSHARARGVPAGHPVHDARSGSRFAGVAGGAEHRRRLRRSSGARASGRRCRRRHLRVRERPRGSGSVPDGARPGVPAGRGARDRPGSAAGEGAVRRRRVADRRRTKRWRRRRSSARRWDGWGPRRC